ncbi:YhgE/Pip domain-containing protein [Bifidobacterium callimiconis]|uniref:YhgE/Pip domain-containing protein n=1 Tax=Bifidobacterium callimiconis TaxID=2306973 RepID=UPI001BDD2E1A|nr:YhgE/Pip domain-containing protein [Bifidobacterium callimiconis]MBT1176915.1 YhgE/Pip domain-containing protein [Bifidobacterium callimiconis]
MRQIWQLFIGDVKRITSNVVSIIIVIGLVAIPSLFTWFNVVASWDPFSNTKNLKFAVASVDDGYKSDLVPLKVNVGDQVLNALRANDQLDWTITTKDDAVDGVKSGKYYASVVIPKSFSKDMMTFFDSDVKHAKLTYYTNEKKNALAPKVTGQGADQVAAQINNMFASTLSDVALNIVSSLSDYLDDADVQSRLGNVNDHIGKLSDQMADASTMLTTYSSLTDSAQSLINNSSTLLTQAAGAADDAKDAVGDTKAAGGTITDALKGSASSLSKALKSSANSYGAVAGGVDTVFDSVNTQATDSAKSLRDEATSIDKQIAEYQLIVKDLGQFRSDIAATQPSTQIGQDVIDTVTRQTDAVIGQLNSVITLQQGLRDKLNDAAGKIESGNSSAQQERDEIKALATQAKNDVASLKTDYDTNLKPQIDSIAGTVANAAQTLSGGATQLESAVKDLSGASGSASKQLGNMRTMLTDVAKDLTDASDKLRTVHDSLGSALSSGDTEMIKQALGTDAEQLADYIAAPVGVTRHAVFKAENFGSALSPFYTTLPLWVGSLLMAVTLKTAVSRRIRAGLARGGVRGGVVRTGENPESTGRTDSAAAAKTGRGKKPNRKAKTGEVKPYQMYLGRFGIFALISLMQTTCLFLGNLLFLRVQCEHPFLYMLAGWTSGLVFIFMIYTLVVSFGNVGKAIGVLFLVLQISGSGGAYPLVVMPDIFTTISPFLPATHTINAIRASMFGIYDNDYWRAIGALLLFIVPTLLLGLVLRKPLVKFNTWYVAQVESTKLL